MCQRLFLFLSLFLIGSTLAGTIQLKDGSLVKGEILSVHQQSIDVQTKFAGLISINLAEVETFSTDKDHHIEFDNNDTTQGKVTYLQDKLIIQEKAKQKEIDGQASAIPIQGRVIHANELLSLWDLTENHPNYIRPIDPWTYKLFLDLRKETGNKDKEDFLGGASAEWNKNGKKLLLYGKFDFGRANDENNEEEYNLGTDYESANKENDAKSWYARAKWKKDRFEDLDSRYAVASGLGYYFIDNEEIILRGRLGVGIVKEEYREDTDSDDTSTALEFEISYKQNIETWGNWYTQVRYNPKMEDLDDYFIKQETGIEIPFRIESELSLSLNIGMDQEYRSIPAEGLSNDDTKYFLRLAATF